MEDKNNFPIYAYCAGDSAFPPSIQKITHAPTKIYYRGTLIPSIPCIAIVGTRKASLEGKKLAYHTAYELAKNGWCIVSGLAFGIDISAHKGALAAHGKTWAVLAHGLDTVQPKEHTSVAQEILESGGCLISEYPALTPPLPHQFLARNRIVSGLSEAVIVIEAPRASGSIATARHAAQQNKQVFVFPGPASSPLYMGSHELIRAGARLVRNLQDIQADLSSLQQTMFSDQSIREAKSSSSLTKTQQMIFDCVASHKKAMSIDTIIEETSIPYQKVHTDIAFLIQKNLLAEDGVQLYKTCT